MSTTETKTVQTPHGDVEYEVVECDSCGNETTPEKAKDFTIGDRVGKACPYCYEEGTISFPPKPFKDEVSAEFLRVSLWPISVAIFLSGRTEYCRAFLLGSLGAILWLGCAAVILFAVL